MKKLKVIFGIILVLGIAYFLGPQRTVDDTIKPVNLPEDLESYLKKSESRYPDIRPETEKIIVWANPKKKNKTPYSIVYFHGYCASRQELVPVTDLVAEDIGANVYYHRLKGHMRKPDALAEASVNDWLNEAVEALEIGKRIGEKVIVMGVSTGATLAVWLAAWDNSKNISACVLISPNFWPNSSTVHISLWPWGEQIARLVLGEYRSWEPRSEKERKFWNTTQPVKVLVTMIALVDLVDKIDLSKFSTPALVIYSPKDQVVSVEAIREKYPQIASKNKKIISYEDSKDTSQHILAGNIISPETTKPVVKMILDFLKTAI
ncbi:MAG: alpha/beta hydrolase [bacterium]|nr:alpha/beta hydrolase [bacterium]